MTRKNPYNNEREALRAAALPRDYQTRGFNQLFRRGYERWKADGEDKTDKLIADIETFAKGAFDENVRERALRRPYVDEPGTLAVLATLAAVCVQEHPRLKDTPTGRLKLIENIQELYTNNILSLIYDFDDPSFAQDIAETIFGKGPVNGVPHAGRVCTGIVDRPDLGDGLFIEIPMAAASRKCLVHVDDEAGGHLVTEVADNNLYIPAEYLDKRYREYAGDAFQRILHAQESSLSPDQRDWLAKNEDSVTDRINRFFNTGHHDHIWKNWSREEQQVKLIVNAVEAAEEEGVALGEQLTATEIYEAVTSYSPEHRWEFDIADQFSSATGIANILRDNEDHKSISINRNGRVNKYELSGYGGSSKQITVQGLEDLFELPCMEAMDERLQNEKPVRKDLFNFARMVMWLPKYQPNPDIDIIVEGLKDVFSRWPWYDEQETDYQVRYEFAHGKNSDGDDYLPMGCDNDDLQRYCIGQNECEYSIWGSIDFPDRMYDQAQSQDGFDGYY